MTTWWFVTPRRPGIDFSFVEARTPLSVDALRAELGPNAVYTHEQRAGYRAEVRSLLYGGADLEQHMRLLHTVRNPRVGDRIEADLPTHLADALPQLSEAALDDAAQPLEDLEEHRRNVEALTRTAAALDALDSLYGNYGRSELHARADKSLEEVAHASYCSRAEATLRKQQQAAESERVEAQSAIDRHDAAQRRLREEIDALKSREAYTAGAELADLRKHLASLHRQVVHADAGAVESSRRRGEARLGVQHSATQAHGDLDNVRDGLSDLSRFARAVGLTARPPDTPTVSLHPAPDDVDIEVPATAFDSESLSVDLTELRGAVHHRSGDVQSLRGELDAVDRAARVLDDADRAAQQASADEEVAREGYAQARATRAAVAEQWRDELQAWTGQLVEHQRLQGLNVTDAAMLAAPDLADRREEIRESLFAAVQQVIDHHTGAAASLEARRADEQRDVDELAARLAELVAQLSPTRLPPPGNEPTPGSRSPNVSTSSLRSTPPSALGSKRRSKPPGCSPPRCATTVRSLSTVSSSHEPVHTSPTHCGRTCTSPCRTVSTIRRSPTRSSSSSMPSLRMNTISMPPASTRSSPCPVASASASCTASTRNRKRSTSASVHGTRCARTQPLRGGSTTGRCADNVDATAQFARAAAASRRARRRAPRVGPSAAAVVTQSSVSNSPPKASPLPVIV